MTDREKWEAIDQFDRENPGLVQRWLWQVVAFCVCGFAVVGVASWLVQP